MKNRALSLAGLIAVVALGACDSDSTTAVNTNLVTLKATLTTTAEIPAPVVASTGSGLFTATLDTVTGQFVYDLTFSGLTSPVNNGHIHGPAVDDHDVGLLARRERPGPIGDTGHLGPTKGGPLQHLAGGDQSRRRRQAIQAVVPCGLVHPAPLRPEHGVHLGELVRRGRRRHVR